MSGQNQATQIDSRVEFRESAARYAELASQDGIRVVPYHSPDVPIFANHPEEMQRKILESLRSQVSVLEEVRAAGYRPINSVQLLWKTLGHLGLVPQPDVFSHIQDTDVINIYSLQQEILSWNLQFFNFISFTLEEVLCRHWFEISRRDPQIAARLYETGLRVVAGEVKGTFDPEIEEHLFEEVGSSQNLRQMIKITRMSTLTSKGGDLAGVIVINRCRLA